MLVTNTSIILVKIHLYDNTIPIYNNLFKYIKERQNRTYQINKQFS